MRKTKSEGKTVGIFANCSQCAANFAMQISTANFAMRNFAMRKPHCEFRNAKNHIANFAMRKITANFAMRNFSMRKPHCNFRNAKRKFRNAKWLPTVCQLFAKIHVLFFSLLIFNICSKICTKLLKLKQEKLHKGTN